MGAAALIIGDWGNSNARLWLCDADGQLLDTRRGPGIAAVRSDGAAIANAFADMTADWPRDVPALLAGVVGASFGWRDAGYLPCPIAIDTIGSGAVRAPTNERAVLITPGISCTNAWGQPDTMRGEELQIAGWTADVVANDALIALPGTHCKWAQLQGGKVTRFHSAISGELFALLRNHSVMIDRAAQNAPHHPIAFAEGVALAQTASDVDLSALIFAARTRQATGGLAPEAAPSLLSGIVIGCDVRTALHHYRAVGDIAAADIAIIGAGPLTTHYCEALKLFGRRATAIDGDAAMRAGLISAAKAAALL